MMPKLKIFLLSLALLLPFQALGVETQDENTPLIHYILSPHPTPHQLYLHVSTVFQGETSGQTLLKTPSQWAGIDYSAQIKNIRLNTQGAEWIEFDKNKPDLKLIRHKPDEMLHISYDIYPLAEASDIRQTIISQNLYQAPGYGLFVIPISVEGQEALSRWNSTKISFSIRWVGLNHHWRTASSHGMEKILQFKGSIQDDLLPALYQAGTLQHYTLLLHEKLVDLSLYGDFKYTKAEFKEALENIVAMEPDILNGDSSQYWISLVQGEVPFSKSEVNFKKCFAMYFPKSMTVADYLKKWKKDKIEEVKLENISYLHLGIGAH